MIESVTVFKDSVEETVISRWQRSTGRRVSISWRWGWNQCWKTRLLEEAHSCEQCAKCLWV